MREVRRESARMNEREGDGVSRSTNESGLERENEVEEAPNVTILVALFLLAIYAVIPFASSTPFPSLRISYHTTFLQRNTSLRNADFSNVFSSNRHNLNHKGQVATLQFKNENTNTDVCSANGIGVGKVCATLKKS